MAKFSQVREKVLSGVADLTLWLSYYRDYPVDGYGKVSEIKRDLMDVLKKLDELENE